MSLNTPIVGGTFRFLFELLTNEILNKHEFPSNDIDGRPKVVDDMIFVKTMRNNWNLA